VYQAALSRAPSPNAELEKGHDMHHRHFQRELFKQRAEELHREAAVARLTAGRPRPQRKRVRETRPYDIVARGIWALRGGPNLIP